MHPIAKHVPYPLHLPIYLPENCNESAAETYVKFLFITSHDPNAYEASLGIVIGN